VPKPEIEEFAKLLVQHVHDPAIEGCDIVLSPNGKGPVAKRWHSLLQDSADVELAKIVIADTVDEVVFALLDAIDSGLMRLTFHASNGNAVDLTEEGKGELGGWYMGTDGWRHMYAQQRFFDDFADLKDTQFE
jgi:hypothetical protein